jgi:hypothetical protein
MRLTPKLERAEAVDGHTVRVEFADGVKAEVDLAYLIGSGPVFEPLTDVAYFRRVRASREANTIVWPNGADIAPETLYAAAKASRADHVRS